jgi:hypothetical protein
MMESKFCRDCGQVKRLDEFYIHSGMADGYLNKCKECVKARERRYRRDNPERVATIDKAKYERMKLSPDFIQGRLEYQRKYRTSEINRAHIIAQRKLRKNKPELCFICKERPAKDAHHPDYRKPDCVQWLCERCHMRLHHSNIIEAI